MNIPKPMTKNTFERHSKTTGKIINKMAATNMKQAAKMAVKQTGTNKLTVTADGAWSRRGFASNYGLVAVMSTETDQILDIEVMSKQCKSCTMYEHKKHTEEYKKWKETHVCSKNHEGSSGKMESEGAKRIWECSVEKNGTMYSTMVGDGDSSTYDTIKNTYNEITVEKGECIGHMQKRVGSGLRELTRKHTKSCNPLSDGKGLGGKGRLTGQVIDSMQTWYGRVIRNTVKNNDLLDEQKVTQMKKKDHGDPTPPCFNGQQPETRALPPW